MSLSDLSLPNGNGSLLLIDDQDQLGGPSPLFRQAPKFPFGRTERVSEVLTLTADNSNVVRFGVRVMLRLMAKVVGVPQGIKQLMERR